MKPFLPIAIILAAAVAAPSAQAATYKITAASHTSTSTKTADGYNGASKVTWKLAKSSKIDVQANTGLAALKIKGTDAIDITTSWPGRCIWTKPFAESFELMVTPGRVSINAPRASLGSMYLGTECTTGISGEPSPTLTSSKVISPSTFKKKTVKLSFSGTTSDKGIAYSWSTKLTLKRSR